MNKKELYALESSFYQRRPSNKKLQLKYKLNSVDNQTDHLKFIKSQNGQLDQTLSTKAMHKSVNELDSSQFLQKSEKHQDAHSFLKKLKKDTIETRIYLDEQKRKEEERKKKALEEFEYTKQMERKQKHEELEKNYQTQRENQIQRKEQYQKSLQEYKQFYKNYQEKQPLYLIMEEKYKQKVDIEAQQGKLSQLRELYKPHRLEDFENHQRRYKDFKKSEEERLQLKKDSLQTTKSVQSHSSLWRGRVHEIVEEELRNQIRQSESQDRKLRKERQKQYASMVKVNHAPKLDEDKQEELLTRKNDFLKSKNLIKIQLQKQEIQTEPDTYKIGKGYFEFAKKYNREHKKVEDDKEKEQRQQQQSEDTQSKSNIQKIQYKNYMKEERVKQQLKKEDPKKEWQQQISKYEGTEKVEKVLLAAQQLDVKAHRKEQMIKYGKNIQSNYVEDLDDCYFNSIKAKIALLKDFHQMK